MVNNPCHCMVVHAYYPLGESRVEREAQALIQRGYQVDVICLRDHGDKPFEIIDNVQIYRLPVRRHRGQGPFIQFVEYLSFFFLAFLFLTWMSLRKKYHGVQVHNLPDFLVFSAIAPKLSGAKIILDLHDLMPEFFASAFHTDMDNGIVRLLMLQERLACRFADHVITVTEHWRQMLIRRGLSPEKVTVVMNVADNKVFYRNNGHSPNGNQKQEDGFHLIYHGTLVRRYGVDLLIKAVGKVADQIPGIRLTIHGVGEAVGDLRRMAMELGIDSRVRFSTSYIPLSDVPAMLLQADLGVVPYRRNPFTDGILPTKLMEYVALGIPVLAADTPIIREYFDETMIHYFQAGDVEDLSRNILYLYRNRERLAEIASNADRFNDEHNWICISAGYAKTLDRLIREPNQV